MTTLNAAAADVLRGFAPNAVTDVTGFGLFGHAHETAERSGVRIVLEAAAFPALHGALEAARAARTGGDPRNREFAPVEPTAWRRSCSRSATTRRPPAAFSSRCRPTRRSRSRRSSAARPLPRAGRLGGGGGGVCRPLDAANARLDSPRACGVRIGRAAAPAGADISPVGFRRVALAPSACSSSSSRSARPSAHRLRARLSVRESTSRRSTRSRRLPRGHRVLQPRRSGAHRLVALAFAVAAWRTVGIGRRAKLARVGRFLATLAQIPLGAITVHYHLNPYLVVAHLLLSSRSSRSACSRCSRPTGPSRAGEPAAGLARAGGRVLVVAVTVLASRDVLDGRGTVPRQLGHEGRAAALELPLRGLLARSRGRRVRHRLPRARRLGVERRSASRGSARLRRPPRASRRADGDRERFSTGRTATCRGGSSVHAVLAAALLAWTVGLVARLWRPVGYETRH